MTAKKGGGGGGVSIVTGGERVGVSVVGIGTGGPTTLVEEEVRPFLGEADNDCGGGGLVGGGGGGGGSRDGGGKMMVPLGIDSNDGAGAGGGGKVSPPPIMPPDNDDGISDDYHRRITSTSKSKSSTTPPASSSKSLEHPPHSAANVRMDALKLIWGAGGIYAAFLYYGSLQEDVFSHVSSSGGGTDAPSSFKQAWFLQVLEALANVVVGFLGRKYVGGTPNLPLKQFAVSGASQVSSKAFTSLALASGLSFPVATLAKSAKMAPVMAGSLLLGGASYAFREYLQVLAIILGTAMVSMGKKRKTSNPAGGGGGGSSSLGLLFIVAALIMDGVTGGVQKRLKKEMAVINVKPKPYDFMYYTNLYMMGVAAVVALVLGEFSSGTEYIRVNPDILPLVVKFSLCSAVGQSFVFYTIAHFDPLVCSTVTTTRKIFSVLLSILVKGHPLAMHGWMGLGMACAGILSEVMEKYRQTSSAVKKQSVPATK